MASQGKASKYKKGDEDINREKAGHGPGSEGEMKKEIKTREKSEASGIETGRLTGKDSGRDTGKEVEPEKVKTKGRDTTVGTEQTGSGLEAGRFTGENRGAKDTRSKGSRTEEQPGKNL